MPEIIPVESSRQLTRFIDFPHDLYREDPHYVPELFTQQKRLLDGKSHPFFDHSEAQYFLAVSDGSVTGRIAAIRNNNYLDYTGSRTGHFGFFDVVEDAETAELLLNTARAWLSSQGLGRIAGPYNFSTNETCGVLVEGFDSPPCVMTTYNRPYYGRLLEQCGLARERDLLSWFIRSEDIPARLVAVAPRIHQRIQSRGIQIRQIDLADFDSEVDRIFEVYNRAWEHNWGFVPMTQQEFRHLAAGVKSILDSDLLYVAEKDGRIIGFCLTVPDINLALQHVPRGRLFPFGFLKLLYSRRRINRLRIITLGVLDEYRRLGIDAYFYLKAFEQCRKKKMTGGEASWVLEDNEMMNRALKNINGRVYKRHRLYGGDL